jgi:hypothetical protein
MMALPSLASLTEVKPTSVIPSCEQVIADEIVSPDRVPLKSELLSARSSAGKYPSQSPLPVETGRSGDSDFGLLAQRSNMASEYAGDEPTGGLCSRQRDKLLNSLKLSGKQKETLLNLQSEITEKAAQLKMEKQSLHEALLAPGADRRSVWQIQHRVNALQIDLSGLSLHFAIDISKALSGKYSAANKQSFLETVLVNYLPSLCSVN